MMKLSQLKLGGKVQFPGLGEISLEAGWAPNELERKAAWIVYVELASRITTASLKPGTGNLREALTSMYQMFGTVRTALRDGGPELAQRRQGMQASFAEVMLGLLNGVLRPVLSEWHPLLRLHEEAQPAGIGAQAHENDWELGPRLAERLNDMRRELLPYLRFLEFALDIWYSPVPRDPSIEPAT